LTYGTDYQDIRHERTTAEIEQFFPSLLYRQRTFEMRQEFDYTGVEGRLLSSSYAPGPDHPKHAAMLADLRRIFDGNSVDGKVAFEYKTRLYFGKLS
jgi:hypothetical protein